MRTLDVGAKFDRQMGTRIMEGICFGHDSYSPNHGFDRLEAGPHSDQFKLWCQDGEATSEDPGWSSDSTALPI